MKLFLGWRLFLISVMLTFPLLTFSIVRAVKAQRFMDDCMYHLDKAQSEINGNKESVDKSIREMDIAINYIEKHNLTIGLTTISGNEADEDLAEWYSVIKARYSYLIFLKDETPENLHKYGDYVIMKNYSPRPAVSPPGISVFPHNTLYCIWFIASLVLALLGIIGIFIFISEKSS